MYISNITSIISLQKTIAFPNNDRYIVTTLNEIPFNFISSVGIFDNIIPQNVIIDMNSTIEIPDLKFDVVNWQVKNNSFVIINTEEDPLIDIDNENSTIIVNDAEISI